MTDLIAKLDALYEKATKGPWVGCPCYRIFGNAQLHDAGASVEFANAICNFYPQLRDMARDAARYRFLRSAAPDFTVMIPRIHGHIGFSHQALDEKLDAAMQGGNK